MSSSGSLPVDDPQVASLIKARSRSAVLKTRLLSVKSRCPDTFIFVFEGADDKIVYYHWISRMQPELKYEPLPLDGKGNVLDLFEAATKDRAGLIDQTYFFIDRDFDDFRGVYPSPKIFMTEAYSVENSLVNGAILSEILKVEFGCHGHPQLRDSICQRFDNVYNQFLTATKEINRKIFVARKLGLEIRKPLPTSAKSIAEIELLSVGPSNKNIDELVVFDLPKNTCLSDINSSFEKLNARERFRGKFALAFFFRWLNLLADHYKEEPSPLFSSIEKSSKVKRSEFTLGNLAAKSSYPAGLERFIASI